MILCFFVKQLIRLPALFLLTFIVILIIFAAFQLLATAVAVYPDFTELKPALFFAHLPVALFNGLPGTLVLSLLIILMNISLKPAPPFIAILVLFIVTCAVFVVCLIAVAGITPTTYETPALSHSFTTNTINPVDNMLIFPEKTDSTMLSNTLVFDPTHSTFKFSYHQSIKPEIENDIVTIELPEHNANIPIKSPYIRNIYEYDTLAGDILNAYGGFNSDLWQYARQPGFMLFLFCIAFIFFIMACGMFTRITRWPFFNIMLFMAIITGIMMFYSFYRSEIYNEFAKVIKDKILLDTLPSLIMLGMGILFILVDILFIPRKYWEKGISDD